jgi:hypothetical protein
MRLISDPSSVPGHKELTWTNYSACASAAMRLDTTVVHARAVDAIYSLAPLIFCSYAEFFIVCLPCIPRILKETGVVRSIKRAFGMKMTSTKPRYDLEHYGTGRSTHNSVSHKVSKNSMKKERLKGAESMEQLHKWCAWRRHCSYGADHCYGGVSLCQG